MERDRFLRRVRDARRGMQLPGIVGPAVAPTIAFEDVVGQFCAAASVVDAEVFKVAGPAAAIREVLRVAGEPPASIGLSLDRSPNQGGTTSAGYIAWDGLDEIVAGLYSDLAEAGWHRIDARVNADSRKGDHRRIERARLGITGATAAIAATGSVVLTHGPGRPRLASALVEHHIVLLQADQLVASLQEALEMVDWSETSNWVAITGPSRTSDIESVLTLGVHGPRRLSVLLLE